MTEMKKIVITCPGCNQEIAIDDALEHQIREEFAGKFAAENKAKEEEFKKREEALKVQEKKIEEELNQKLEAEKKKMWAIALEKADERMRERLKDESEKKNKELESLREELETQKKKRAEAEETELQLRKEKVKLEEDKKAFELEKQRQLDAERAKIKEETARAIADEHRLKDAEKEKLVADMRRQIEELKRKAEQGSQQTQGEVLELELEEMLKSQFPVDEIVPVPKGINGADIIQNVRDQRGRMCGAIAWELKRTKAWSEGWVQKLKDDQRKVKAEIAVLVTQAMPDGIKSIGFYSGIYVATYEAVLGVAAILRHDIIKIASVKALEEGKDEKKEVIYNYLCSTEFRSRVEAIVEATVAAKESLDKEKRAFTKIWAEREKQIDRIETNMIGMYGDMQGIAGRSLPQIKSLELEPGDELGAELREMSEELVAGAIIEEAVEPVVEEQVPEKKSEQALF